MVSSKVVGVTSSSELSISSLTTVDALGFGGVLGGVFSLYSIIGSGSGVGKRTGSGVGILIGSGVGILTGLGSLTGAFFLGGGGGGGGGGSVKVIFTLCN